MVYVKVRVWICVSSLLAPSSLFNIILLTDYNIVGYTIIILLLKKTNFNTFGIISGCGWFFCNSAIISTSKMWGVAKSQN